MQKEILEMTKKEKLITNALKYNVSFGNKLVSVFKPQIASRRNGD